MLLLFLISLSLSFSNIVYAQNCLLNETCVLQENCLNNTEDILNSRNCEENKICCSDGFVRNKLLECGMRRPIAPTLDIRILNENQDLLRKNEDVKESTEYGEFPWMILVLRKIEGTDDELERLCGGSLISASMVLTTAHTLKREFPSNLIVRAGEWDIDSLNEMESAEERQVVQIVKHKQFNKATLFNDIAVLRLQSAFELSASINVICLPPLGQKFDNKRCFASGWGKNSFDSSGTYQSILQKVELPVIPHQLCESQLRSTEQLTMDFKLHHSFICAGSEENRDSCTGDGGSALVCPIEGTENQFYQAGIVSWGIGCGLKNVPGVYTNVPNFVDWIKNQMMLE